MNQKYYQIITIHTGLKWTDTNTAIEFFVGTEALRVVNDILFLEMPIKRGLPNENDYKSPRELLSDVQAILEYAMISELGIERSAWPEYSVTYIISDLYDRNWTSAVTEMFLYQMNFGNICVMQESLCATLGAGMSAACVVDVGAQTTTIFMR